MAGLPDLIGGVVSVGEKEGRVGHLTKLLRYYCVWELRKPWRRPSRSHALLPFATRFVPVTPVTVSPPPDYVSNARGESAWRKRKEFQMRRQCEILAQGG